MMGNMNYSDGQLSAKSGRPTTGLNLMAALLNIRKPNKIGITALLFT